MWVTVSYRIQKPEQVDTFISAEIPDPVTEPALHKIVTELMIRGPCGISKPKAHCMTNGDCSKHFPKKYDKATYFDKDGYIHYKRVLNERSVLKGNILLDNAFVVPYNKKLLLHFAAHINVEYCGWSMMIKYILKYISKGADRIRFKITKSLPALDESESNSTKYVDEIKYFVDARFICPHKAAWRIFDFPIHNKNPPVQVLIGCAFRKHAEYTF